MSRVLDEQVALQRAMGRSDDLDRTKELEMLELEVLAKLLADDMSIGSARAIIQAAFQIGREQACVTVTQIDCPVCGYQEGLP